MLCAYGDKIYVGIDIANRRIDYQGLVFLSISMNELWCISLLRLPQLTRTVCYIFIAFPQLRFTWSPGPERAYLMVFLSGKLSSWIDRRMFLWAPPCMLKGRLLSMGCFSSFHVPATASIRKGKRFVCDASKDPVNTAIYIVDVRMSIYLSGGAFFEHHLWYNLTSCFLLSWKTRQKCWNLKQKASLRLCYK